MEETKSGAKGGTTGYLSKPKNCSVLVVLVPIPFQ
jgi:hypothetical protein